MQDKVSANPMLKIKIGEYVFTKGMKRPDASDNVKLALFNAIDLLDGDITGGVLSEKDVQIFNEKIKGVTLTDNSIKVENSAIKVGTRSADMNNDAVKAIFDVIDLCDGKKSGILSAKDVALFKYRIENPIKKASTVSDKPTSEKPKTSMNTSAAGSDDFVDMGDDYATDFCGSIIPSITSKLAQHEIKLLPEDILPSADNLGLKLNSKGKIDMNQFSLEALKARYATYKYVYKTSKNSFGTYDTVIYNKFNNEIAASFVYSSARNNNPILNVMISRNKNDYMSLQIHDGNFLKYKRLSNNISYNVDYYNTGSSYAGKKYSISKSNYDNGNNIYSRYDTNGKVMYKNEINITNDRQILTYYVDDKKYEILGNCPNYTEVNVSLIRLLMSKYPDKPLYTEFLNKFINLGKNNSNIFIQLITDYDIFRKQMLSKSCKLDSISLLKFDIQKSKNLSEIEKDALINLINNAYNEVNKPINNPAKTSKINNTYYKGQNYYIKTSNSIITVKNLQTSKVHKIDLKALVRPIPIIVQQNLCELISQLPGEVLEDLASELSRPLMNGRNISWVDDAAAFYIPIDNSITLGANGAPYADKHTIVHELGHAISYIVINNKNVLRLDSKLTSIYGKELNEYIKKGLPVYGKASDISTTVGESSTYPTKNIGEMFAECYSLLMLGDCSSKGIILEYFPETLKAVKETLMNIRKLPDNVRKYKFDNFRHFMI